MLVIAARALHGAAHDHLVIVHLELAQRFDVAHLDAIPLHVMNGAGLFVDEMVVRLGDGIEDDAVLAEIETLQQSFIDEEIERVVDGGAGDPGEALADALPDQVGRRMLVRVEDVIADRDALRRGLDSAVAERRGGVFRQHGV